MERLSYMKNIKGIARITLILYVAAILVSAVAVYGLDYAYNPPQPDFHMSYNAISQVGQGYVNDTFSYPIEITSIYCTQPNGERVEFPDSSNNIVQPNSNTYIVIGVSAATDKLPINCADWKLTYLDAQGIPSNTNNGIVVQQSG
jgi:hypothetical protein